MYRNKAWALALLLISLCLGGYVHSAQAPRTLALMLGDVESRPAVLAVRGLQAELQDLNVAVRIIPANGMTPADRAALTGADVVVVNARGRQAMAGLSAELLALQKARRPVFAVGGAIDDSLRELGVRDDKTIQSYHSAGGVENMGNLLRYILHKHFDSKVDAAPVRAMPEAGLYDVAANRISDSYEQYLQGYASYKAGAPWVAVPFYRASLVAGQTLPLAAIVARLEACGYNVLPVFGYPYDVPLRFLLDENGKSRVDLIVALGMKVGGTVNTGALLDKIGVPAINAITLSQQSLAQWRESKIGLDIIERTWQLAGAEMAGLIQPTVVASRERVSDAQTGPGLRRGDADPRAHRAPERARRLVDGLAPQGEHRQAHRHDLLQLSARFRDHRRGLPERAAGEPVADRPALEAGRLPNRHGAAAVAGRAARRDPAVG